MDFHTAVFLAKFFSGTFGLGESCFRQFLLEFAQMSHPSATGSQVLSSLISSADDAPALLEFHLRHLEPVELDEALATPMEGLTLVLERKLAKVPYLPQDVAQNEENYQGMGLEERALSASLLVFPCGTFRLVILGDEGVPVDQPQISNKAMWKRIGIYPWNSGKGAGLSHFLVALFLLLEAWHRKWNATLNAIDGVISFKVSTHFNQCPVTTRSPY